VKSGADINARDQNGWSIALRAVRDADFLALLTPGLYLNVADDKGNSIWSSPGWDSALFARRQAEIGVPLMQNGKPGIGPLHVAVKEALLSDVKYFLQRGVNPNQVDQDGLTPLHEVARWTGGPGEHRINRSLIVKALLDAGVDVNARTAQGLTPLMLANNQPGEITQILVDRKADVNATAIENGKPLAVMDYFLRKANTQGIEVLLKAGARKTNPH
jgi:ankyrin repeat protein